MAPYGEPRYVDKIHKLFKVQDDGSFWVNMDYFSYHYSPRQTFNGRFVDLFGEPRVRDSEFFTTATDPTLNPSDPMVKRNQHYADVAASIQRVTEETLLKMANYVYKETGLSKLCMAGGVALNSVANGRILRETPFEDVFIQPAAGDSGGAVGAALYAHHVLFGKPRQFVLEHAYWGEEYDEALMDMLVDDLIQQKVVGWFQGRFEWGPRALGNRSILADPRRKEMKDIVNTKIKFRELFRPFAPVVLEERTGEFFELPEPSRHYPARYMLMVVPVKEDKQRVIQAVTHQGGTGRLQTVRRDLNPRYYRVVEKFGEATGVPVLLNTSFNLRGEPIVNSPAHAFNTFSNSGIDVLVLDHFVVRK